MEKGQVLPAPGGGGTPLYKPYRYVPHPRVGFLCRFGLKTPQLFSSGIEYDFQGNWELRECMNVFIVSLQMSKKEREICEFEMDFKKSFLLLF